MLAPTELKLGNHRRASGWARAPKRLLGEYSGYRKKRRMKTAPL
jgi:hypothetical protein